jgi:hypothetical protein
VSATWRLVSPAHAIGRGASIAIVELRGDVSAVLTRLLGHDVAGGRVRLVEPPDADQMIVARTAMDEALLFPHAGAALTRRVIEAIERAGAVIDASDTTAATCEPTDAASLSPLLHDALVRAASPLAIDLLLEQPERWDRVWAARGTDAAMVLPAEGAAALRRLIDPPLVVAIGPPNIGKSSLLNALCGRSVSVVADEPGTTRDHVGALVSLAGLTVRFVDAPGIGGAADPSAEAALQRDSQSLALATARAADLLLWCGDGVSGFLAAPAPGDPLGGVDRLRVALRGDLGAPPGPADVHLSVRTGEGVAELVEAIRERLAPARWRADQRAWRFWDLGRASTGVP